jgi:hypothetical protein
MNKNLVLMLANVLLLICAVINIIECLIDESYLYAILTVIPSSIFVFLAQLNYIKIKAQ